LERSPLEYLLHQIRLAQAKREEPASILRAMLGEIRAVSGYSGKEAWNMAVELIADHLGIIDEPWKYSLPDLPNSPYFRGDRSALKGKRSVPEKVAKHVRDTGLVEMFVEAARAKPDDYLGAIFMEEGFHGRNIGQVLTPRSVVECINAMVMLEFEKSPEMVWVDRQTLQWAADYLEAYGYFPFWLRKAIEEASETVEAFSKPKTVLDPCVGTGRFLIYASLRYPHAPLILFGVEIDQSLYRACLVNMALFSRHPYSIVCADSLRIDEKYAGPSSPLWDYGNLWNPPDLSKFYVKPPPATATTFNLAEWVKMKRP